MKQTLLITFGCSWTFGVGVGYVENMKKEDYIKIAWSAELSNKFSFRGILAEKFDLVNKNFAEGGSSNQKQFRLAKKFFTSVEFNELRKKYDNIIVLWGITSTARNEFYRISTNDYHNFFYSDNTDSNWPFPKLLVKHSYDHNTCVDELSAEILFWNEFFKCKNIKNLWFDTFNHHNYFYINENDYNIFKGTDWPLWENYVVTNFIGVSQEIVNEITEFCWTNSSDNKIIYREINPRDLMSLLAKEYGLVDIDGQMHMSEWKDDTNRTKFLVLNKILNPISYHPTKLGHQKIAEILAPFIEKLI